MSWFKRNIKVDNLITLGMILLLSPFLALIFYTHPFADDVLFANSVSNFGVIGGIIDFYFNWSGRYVVMGLGLLNKWISPFPPYYHVSLLLYLCLFSFSIYLFYKVLYGFLNVRIPLLFSTLLTLFLIFQTSPDLYSLIYWHPGVSAYTFTISIFLLFVVNLFSFLTGLIKKATFLVFSLLLSFILGGSIELILPFILLIFFIIVLRIKNIEKNKRFSILLVLVFYLIFLTVFLISPGNYNRLEVSEMLLVENFFQKSILNFAMINVNYLQNPVYLISLLVIGIYLINNKLQIPKLSWIKIKPLWLFVLIQVFLFFYILALTKIMGILPGRVANFVGIFYIFSHLFLLLYFVTYYQSKIFQFQLSLKPINKILVTLILLFTFLGVYPTSVYKLVQAERIDKSRYLVFSSNFLHATYTLFFEAGYFKRHYQTQDKILENAQLKKSKSAIIAPYPDNVKLLFRLKKLAPENTEIITKDPLVEFYQLDTLIVKGMN
ncbi:MAG: hypothetical protein JXR34_01265 [Bacteroidales bacterium]|nr:hypothetical protein [Bacteroidales bacterium]